MLYYFSMRGTESIPRVENITQALRRQVLLVEEIRTRFTGAAVALPNIQQPEKRERLANARTFEKVVFGHQFANFDRDQLILYYLAIQVGAVSLDTPATFTSEPSETELKNPKVLVAEPYMQDEDPLKTVKKGNYATGSKDEPAAAVFYQHFTREIGQLPNSAVLVELLAWLKQVDTRDEESEETFAALDAKTMKLFTPIFYGLKLRIRDPKTLLEKSVALLDDLLASSADVAAIETKYQVERELYNQKRREDFQILEERAKDARFLKQATTVTGVKLAYFDIRGLNIHSQALFVATKHTGADVVFLIDTVVNPEAANEAIGTQFIIKATRDAAKIETTLSERLQTSEKLFGKGFQITKKYGGHPGFISTPVDMGSDLDPSNVWVSLQQYFNVPRYSEAEFEEKSRQVAQKLETRQGLPYLFVPPDNPYSLAEWQMVLRLPIKTGGQVVITLSESDLPLYESLLTDDVDKNRDLLSRKTVVSEPKEVAAKRFEVAQATLHKFTAERQATQILLSLDDLNITSIQQLPLEQQMALLQIIAQDSLAIDQVWNKDNMLFRITQELPDWILKDLETYKAERFKYLSVPKKIHVLIESITQQLDKLTEVHKWESHIATLMTIIVSPEYQESHLQYNYDSLLEKILMVLVRPTFPRERAVEALKILEEVYGPTTDHMWQSVLPEVIAQVKEKFPQQLLFLNSEKVATEYSSNFLEIKEPTVDTIKPNAPVQTILIEVGRPIADVILKDGIIGRSHDGSSEPVHHMITEFSSEIISTNKSLKIGRQHNEHIVLAKKILEHIQLIDVLAPESDIRIIVGGSPNILMQVLIAVTPRHLWDRVFFCNFDMQTKQFFDAPSLAELSNL